MDQSFLLIFNSLLHCLPINSFNRDDCYSGTPCPHPRTCHPECDWLEHNYCHQASSTSSSSSSSTSTSSSSEMRLQMKERVDRGGGGRPCQQRDGRACVQTSGRTFWSGEHRRQIKLSQKTITLTALANHENVANGKALQITTQPLRPALSPISRHTLSANSSIT